MPTGFWRVFVTWSGQVTYLQWPSMVNTPLRSGFKSGPKLVEWKNHLFPCPKFKVSEAEKFMFALPFQFL